ncbi:uncharacterized protein LOC125568270 [Nematostella vectensis]|uniref:uncharacterized protein LOC125568270 n=1 Tax=Nematostella vectensis TaxID=45351 RepID=UPI002076D970|nr:uncharacterized protein LOC125568270 [Nematostella vectensis]
MRIFERLVCKQEVSSALNSQIRSDQFAYKQCHNTTMALLKCQHYWLNWLDTDVDFVRVFSFDFSKAFDSVSHEIVCRKLKCYDINPYVINWIVSFLGNRKKGGGGWSVNEVCRDRQRCSSNDIIPVNPSKILLVKYADDITLSISQRHNSADLSSVEVQNIKNWSKENRMTLNLSKTWEMVVRGRTKKPIPEPEPDISRKEELKLLGVTFNEQPCNWDTHFEQMISKASSRLYILRVCKFYGYTMQKLTLLFDSLIMSLFYYTIEVWACAYDSKYLLQVDRFCKRAARYEYTTSYTPIAKIIRDRDVKLWERITSDDNHCLSCMLPKRKTRSLRKRGHDFILPQVKTERFKRCFVNRCLFNLI